MGDQLILVTVLFFCFSPFLRGDVETRVVMSGQTTSCDSHTSSPPLPDSDAVIDRVEETAFLFVDTSW